MFDTHQELVICLKVLPCFLLQVTQQRKRQYADSIESLVRNNIQKMKIDMANEVIDAGRFDMQTSMEERKQTLEALLQVPALHCCLSLHPISSHPMAYSATLGT